jgi:hypothetical protein
MSTNLQTEPQITPIDTRLGAGGVWYQLQAERDRICETLLGMAHVSQQANSTKVEAIQLQTRLRLVDDAVDRLTTGSYGDCVSCGQWIEDTKLHADPALPFCCACQPRSSTPAPFLRHFPYQLDAVSSAIRGLLRT